jgi:hypothetical protein
VNCVICGIRKPRRQCPGVNGAICSLCCGTGREETIDCPIGCEYLKEAHRHEKPPVFDPATLPNQDVRVPEGFLEQHQWLLVLLGSAVVDGALATPGTTDYDLREALGSLIRTFRGQDSGLVIESKPVNLAAANILESVRSRIADIRRRIAEAEATSTLDDSTILAILVFLQRLEYANNNGRRHSRAFFDFLMRFHVPAPESPQETETLEPEPQGAIL